jgi:hypothetical protein
VPEQDAFPAAAILDNWSEDPWTNGLQIDRREDMEKLAVPGTAFMRSRSLKVEVVKFWCGAVNSFWN